MKKNITINLFGTLYAIDEDAYNLLEQYLQSMKSYFARQKGGEEIADDIEHRVAELLWEKKNLENMEAVNIETVKEIIERIGNPADIDTASTDSNDTNDADANRASKTDNVQDAYYEEVREEIKEGWGDKIKNRLKNRRLYRDPNDKIVGGVLSGIARYFDSGDPMIWRLGYVLSILILWGMMGDFWIFNYIGSLSWWLIFGYIIMVAIVPVARTTEDRLRMEGKKVNPENIKEQIINDAQTQSAESVNSAYDTTARNNNSGCLLMLLKGFLVFMLFPFIMFLIFIAVMIIFITGKLFTVGTSSPGIFSSIFGTDTMLGELITNNTSLWSAGMISLAIVIGIIIFALYRLLFVTEKQMRGSSKATLVIIWIIALIVCISSFATGLVKLESISPFHNNIQIHVNMNEDSLYDDSTDVAAPDTIGWEGE